MISVNKRWHLWLPPKGELTDCFLHLVLKLRLEIVSRERRRRRSVKCTEIKQEATQLLDIFSNIMKSCKHPQLLEDITPKMVERGKQSLTKAVTDLDHMIHKQSAKTEDVC